MLTLLEYLELRWLRLSREARAALGADDKSARARLFNQWENDYIERHAPALTRESHT